MQQKTRHPQNTYRAARGKEGSEEAASKWGERRPGGGRRGSIRRTPRGAKEQRRRAMPGS